MQWVAWSKVQSPQKKLHSIKILALNENNGNIRASIIYLFIENDGIEGKKHQFHTVSVEKYFQNHIIEYTLTWSS